MIHRIKAMLRELNRRWIHFSEKILFTSVPRGNSYLRRVIWGLPMFAFALLLIVNLSSWDYVKQLDKTLSTNQSRMLTEQVALRVENLLNERINDLALLATIWTSEAEPKRATHFMAEATWLVQREPSYHVINYVDPQSVIRLSAPEGKRPELINLDLKTLPGRQQLHQQVRDLALPLASPPMTLTTNKPGIALWYPVFDEHESPPPSMGSSPARCISTRWLSEPLQPLIQQIFISRSQSTRPPSTGLLRPRALCRIR